MTETANVVIVGAGQAGLSLSYELRRGGVEHIVLERGRVAETWRGRWNSFCLVIPNWTVQLPGHRYEGDPDGFMARDEIVAHLAGYARSFDAPVREGVAVTALEAHDRGGFVLRTSSGEIRARRVVLASGAYQKPHRPPAAAVGLRDRRGAVHASRRSAGRACPGRRQRTDGVPARRRTSRGGTRDVSGLRPRPLGAAAD